MSRPTPETDAKKWIEVGYNSYVVSATFAQKLERERDEALELLASEKITRNHIIKRSVEVERERDEARFLLKAAQSVLDEIHLEVGVWIKIMKENTD
jgi:predicted nucleic acid-binding protein